jgi:hypothetical protein
MSAANPNGIRFVDHRAESSVMGPPNHAPGVGVMGDPDSSLQLYLMGGADRGPRFDVFSGPDVGPRVDLMGESDPEFVDALFTGSIDEHRDRAVARPAAVLAWGRA